MPGGNVFHGAGLITDEQLREAILIPENPASAPIGDYSLGESVFYKSFGAVGYPTDDQGTVRVSKTGMDTAHQTFFPNDMGNLRIYERYWEGGLMNWTAWAQHTHPNATTTDPGFLPPGDKVKLNSHGEFGSIQRVRNVAYGIGNGAWVVVPINSAVEKNNGNVATYNADHTWTVNQAGTHTLWFDASWANNNTGQRLARWLVGSVNWSYIRVTAAATSNFFLHATGHIDAGTVITPYVWQNSGGILDLHGPMRMSITRLGP